MRASPNTRAFAAPPATTRITSSGTDSCAFRQPQRTRDIRTPPQTAAHGGEATELVPQMSRRSTKRRGGAHRVAMIRKAAAEYESVVLHPGGVMCVQACVECDLRHDVAALPAGNG